MKLKIHDCINGNYLFLQKLYLVSNNNNHFIFQCSQKAYQITNNKKVNHRAIAFKWQMENVLENCGTLKYSCRTEQKEKWTGKYSYSTILIHIIYIFFYLPTNVCLKRVELCGEKHKICGKIKQQQQQPKSNFTYWIEHLNLLLKK